MTIPRIEACTTGAALMVEDKPFLILGGEVHNSSSSSLDYMESAVWPHVRGLNLNTLLVPVMWEQLEPEEGQFDFHIVEGLIDQAVREKKKLVILWFGLWKNGESTYVPAWMKRSPTAYFRMKTRFGQPLNAVSPLCRKAVERDAQAFARLVGHIREYDGSQTVIMLQIENEMGLLGDTRDFSEQANEVFRAEIPAELAALCGKQGAWKQAFGGDAAEIFMTYHYAKATQSIAQAGKKAYPLPFYVNAWLEQYPELPGKYPSGGPIAKWMKLWKQLCPAVDLLAPDIYLPDFDRVCAEYTKQDNILFIPEARPSMDSASNVFSALGRHHAIGFSPFAVESLVQPVKNADAALLGGLNIDLPAFHTYRAGEYLARSYGVLRALEALILEHRGTGRLQGFTQYTKRGELLSFGRYVFQVTYEKRSMEAPKGGGLILQQDAHTFIFCGYNARIVPCLSAASEGRLEILRLEELSWEDRSLERRRILNGDELYIALTDEIAVYRCELMELDTAEAFTRI